jgi:ectoine hydroxylase-related dioxygenase (phytanoyl-CoA dioxygenase family)
VDSDLFRWDDDPDLRAVTHRSPLADLASSLLDSRQVALIEDQWFASEPGPTTPSPWHQDDPYYRLDRPFLTIWVALDDVGADGALRVVPRSHRGGSLYAPAEFSSTGTTVGSTTVGSTTGGGDVGPAASGHLAPVPDVDADPEHFPVHSWPVVAGDAIALDSRTLHATGRVELAGPFRRLSTRWAAPGTRYQDRPWDTAAFWDLLPHGLSEGDLLAGPVFPLVAASDRP